MNTSWHIDCLLRPWAGQDGHLHLHIVGAEADRLGTRGLLRLVRQLEEQQERHRAALLHLTEGRSPAAWRVLAGCDEP